MSFDEMERRDVRLRGVWTGDEVANKVEINM